MNKEKNAGHEIIERFVVGDMGIALGVNENAPANYVTWSYRKDAPMHFFWGHYFAHENQAIQDYEKRIADEIHYYEERTHKPFTIPELCLSIEPSSGDLINIKRGFHGCYPSDWNRKGKREANRETATYVNEKMGVTKQQEAAMLQGSMFGWTIPAANPRNYDENGRLKTPNRSEQER